MSKQKGDCILKVRLDELKNRVIKWKLAFRAYMWWLNDVMIWKAWYIPKPLMNILTASENIHLLHGLYFLIQNIDLKYWCICTKKSKNIVDIIFWGKCHDKCNITMSSVSLINAIPWNLRLYDKWYCKDVKDNTMDINTSPSYYFILGRSVKLNLEEKKESLWIFGLLKAIK